MKFSDRWIRAASLLAFALPVSAYALTDEEPLSMRYEEPVAANKQQPATAPVAPLPGGCAVYVTKLEDLRPYPEYVGNASFSLPGPLATPLVTQSIRGGDGREWTAGALRALGSRGFQPRIGETAPASGDGRAVVSVGLKLAHTWSAGLNLLSHVVLRVSFQSGGVAETRDYHGLGSKLNWANGNGEFMTALNNAMAEALVAFAGDAALACAGRNLAPQTASTL